MQSHLLVEPTIVVTKVMCFQTSNKKLRGTCCLGLVNDLQFSILIVDNDQLYCTVETDLTVGVVKEKIQLCAALSYDT